MQNLHEQLKPYARRVRVVSAWRGAAIGLMVGAACGAVLAGLRVFRVLDVEWVHIGIVVAASVLAGGLMGAFRRISLEALASSVDRRGKHNNRLRTAMEHQGNELFATDLAGDAMSSLQRGKPASAYPIKWLKWHTVGAITLGLACGALWLSESEMLLSKEAKEVRKSQREAATEIRRVAANLVKEPAHDPESERIRKQLVSELQKMEHDLNRGNLDEAETLKKAQQLKKEADALASQALQQAGKSARTAEKALNDMAKAAAEERGVQVNSPELMSSNDVRAASENMVMDRLDELENLISNLSNSPTKDEWSQPLVKSKLDRRALLDNLWQASEAIKNSKTLTKEQKDDLKARINDLRNAALDPSKSDEELSKKANDLANEMQSSSAGSDQALEQKAKSIQGSTKPDRQALQKSLNELDQKLKSGTPLSEQDRQAIRSAMQNLQSALKNGSDEQVKQATAELKSALQSASPRSSEQVLKDAQQKASSGQSMSKEELTAAEKAAEDLKDRMSKESYQELQKALQEMESNPNQGNSKKLSKALSQASGEVNISLDKNRAKLSEMLSELDNLAELLNPAAKQAAKENLEKIKAKLQRGEKLTAEEQKALEEAMNELKKAIEDFKNSEEIQKAIEEIKNSKEFKELMEMAKKLQDEADRQRQAQQNGQTTPPKLTPEQVREMQKKLEEIGKLLKDPKRREEVLNALKEALQNAGAG